MGCGISVDVGARLIIEDANVVVAGREELTFAQEIACLLTKWTGFIGSGFSGGGFVVAVASRGGVAMVTGVRSTENLGIIGCTQLLEERG